MNKFILIIIAVTVLNVMGSGVQLCMEAEQAFNDGNGVANTDHARARELWGMAAELYEQAIMKEKLANGPLFYNLGNVYFRLGNTGKAVLNYRRALEFSPDDMNLRRNYAYARSLCKDNIKEAEGRKVLKTLFFFHYDFSLHTREILFIVLFSLFWVLAAVHLKVKTAAVKTGIIAAGCLALAFAVSMCATEYSAGRNPAGVITAEETTGRKGNGMIYDASFKAPLHAGTEFILLDRRAGWLEIQLQSGQSTWIQEEDGELVEL